MLLIHWCDLSVFCNLVQLIVRCDIFFFYSNTMVLFLSLSLLPVLVYFKKIGFSKALCVFVHIILIANTSKQDEVVSKNVCLCKCVVFEILPDLDVSQVTIYVLFYSICQIKMFLLNLKVCKLSHM